MITRIQMCRGGPGFLMMGSLMMKVMKGHLSAQGCRGTELLSGTLGG